jgi:hypothetical protein
MSARDVASGERSGAGDELFELGLERPDRPAAVLVVHSDKE